MPRGIYECMCCGETTQRTHELEFIRIFVLHPDLNNSCDIFADADRVLPVKKAVWFQNLCYEILVCETAFWNLSRVLVQLLDSSSAG